ncbi:MAG TPA: ABC transporter ATP-binding protein [Kiritimatiellia bacterium]|nr:ABC transporter ATP-binding protein [Kiritimatiellia bacterium]
MNTERSSDPLLAVENLSVAFFTEEGRVDAVRNISFDVQRGETLSIVGESGSGKSVSAYSILRLIQRPGRITGGRITLFPRGRDPIEITALSDNANALFDVRGGRVSMIFQEPMTALSPVYTIGNQIMEAILLHQPVTKKEAEARALEMLTLVGIARPEERMRHYPHELSGGMRQRAVIAMALVCRPELLIADEPTTALDVTIQAQILKLIQQMKDEIDASVLFITHDLGVVAQISDRVVVMNHGRIVESADVFTLFEGPKHPYTKGLLASMPRADMKQARLATVRAGTEDIAELPPHLTALEQAGIGGEPHLVELKPGHRVLAWPRKPEVAPA